MTTYLNVSLSKFQSFVGNFTKSTKILKVWAIFLYNLPCSLTEDDKAALYSNKNVIPKQLTYKMSLMYSMCI